MRIGRDVDEAAFCITSSYPAQRSQVLPRLVERAAPERGDELPPRCLRSAWLRHDNPSSAIRHHRNENSRDLHQAGSRRCRFSKFQGVREHAGDENVDEAVHLRAHGCVEVPDRMMQAGGELHGNRMITAGRDRECDLLGRGKRGCFNAAGAELAPARPSHPPDLEFDFLAPILGQRLFDECRESRPFKFASAMVFGNPRLDRHDLRPFVCQTLKLGDVRAVVRIKKDRQLKSLLRLEELKMRTQLTELRRRTDEVGEHPGVGSERYARSCGSTSSSDSDAGGNMPA